MESLIKRTFLFQSLEKVCFSLLKLSGYLSIIEGEIETMTLAGSAEDLLKLFNDVSYFLDCVFLNYIKSKLLFTSSGSWGQVHIFNKHFTFSTNSTIKVEEVSRSPFVVTVLGELCKGVYPWPGYHNVSQF